MAAHRDHAGQENRPPANLLTGFQQLPQKKKPYPNPLPRPGLNLRAFSPDVSGLPSLPASRAGAAVPPPAAPRGSPVPPPEIEQYQEVEPEPFNFWPYLLFGAVLVGLALITEDPRDAYLTSGAAFET